ncbi:alpha-L-fucosidase [Stieleria magnilauensis]|uniref:alpha-L-fucosidase n=1 Tax=Stieleria magnilauensis TaxID=2527963 RepID=A0ABX5XW86_9BACT|nr:Alpha-L-fucosidase [Planctomycetes bacterium TBK1r]
MLQRVIFGFLSVAVAIGTECTCRAQSAPPSIRSSGVSPMPVLASDQAVTFTSEKAPNTDSLDAPYDGSWESLQRMPVPAWFDDGKIGIFIHWGPYSVIGHRKGGRGYAEHVPKMIYEDPAHYYPYMKQRWGRTPPEFGYKDIIPEFKAEKWNPDEWASLFAKVGAKYVVLTAEHHDGWANWDSDLTPWNAVDRGPKRDLVGELGKAVRKRGLKYAPSYHRERHTGFFAKAKYAVHSEPRDDIAEEMRRVPEAASLYGPFDYDKAFVDDYVARWKEIQDKYHPDFLWVDDFPIYTRDGNQVRKGKMKPEIKYFDDRVRGMITDFMNDAAGRGQDVYCNNKGANRNWPDGVGCLEKDNLKLKVIGPKWQSCTTFGTSFGYLEGDTYKTVESVLHEMIEVVSRNGNFLINIGPKADGTIPKPQVERLHAMGDWLKINGDAIYGSRYWKVSEQKDQHLVFTTNGKKLYAIKLSKPESPFTITGTAGWGGDQVKGVRLLGSDAGVAWEMTAQGVRITPPADLGPSQYAWSFEIATTDEQHHPNVIVTDAASALKGTKAVDLNGNADREEK